MEAKRVGLLVPLSRFLVAIFPPLCIVAFVFGVVVFSIRASEESAQRDLEQRRANHERIVATTQDASAGTGLVRIRQHQVITPDGGCSITIQRYTRWSEMDLYTTPHITTLPCTKVGGA